MTDTKLWSIEQARVHLGAASVKSASRTLSRWGVRAVTYERGASGRPEARYDAAEVQAAKQARPGRGARTDVATSAGKTLNARGGPGRP